MHATAPRCRALIAVSLVVLASCGEPPGSGEGGQDAPRWTAPIEIGQSGTRGTGPRLGIDAGGNTLAVWEEWDGTTSTIWASRMPAGGAWSAPEVIGRGDSPNATLPANPALAVHPDGSALVVWVQKTAGNLPWFNRYAASGGWGAPAPVPGARPEAAAAAVASRGNGDAVATWSTREAIWTAEHTGSGGWETPSTIGGVTNGSSVGSPRVAAAAGATAFIWAQGGSDGLRSIAGVVGSGTSLASEWHPVRTLIDMDRGCCDISGPSADARGNAVMLFGHMDPYRGYGGLSAARFAANSGWSAAAPVTAEVPLLPGDFALGPDGQGVAVLTAAYRFQDPPRLWSMRYDGATWAAAVPIEGPGTEDARDVDVVVGGATPLAVWVNGQTDPTVWVAQAGERGSWSRPQGLAVSRGTESCGPDRSPRSSRPTVVADTAGNAVAAWAYFDCVRLSVWSSRLRAR